jgi:hypothetical protein
LLNIKGKLQKSHAQLYFKNHEAVPLIQVGERAVRLKHILQITANREIPETDQQDNSTEEEEEEQNKKLPDLQNEVADVCVGAGSNIAITCGWRQSRSYLRSNKQTSLDFSQLSEARY